MLTLPIMPYDLIVNGSCLFGSRTFCKRVTMTTTMVCIVKLLRWKLINVRFWWNTDFNYANPIEEIQLSEHVRHWDDYVGNRPIKSIFFVVSTRSVFEVLNWTVHDLLFQTQDLSRRMGFNTPMIMIIQSTFIFLTN